MPSYRMPKNVFLQYPVICVDLKTRKLGLFCKDFLNYNSLLTPDTNVFGLGPGARSIDMTSALWP